MSCESPCEPRMAPAPFNNPCADTILRTADNVKFYLFRWMLEDASPVLASLLAMSQSGPGSTAHCESELFKSPLCTPPDSAVSSRASSPGVLPAPIDVVETSRTLETVLRPYYPFPSPPTFASFDDAQSVLVAIHRLQLTRIAPLIFEAARPHIKANPLRAYAFALRHGLEDLARLAAHEYLAVEDPNIPADSEELEDITARQYRRLVVYRQECSKVLQTFVKDNNLNDELVPTWYPEEIVKTGLSCKPCIWQRPKSHHIVILTRNWAFVRTRLLARPSADAVKDMQLVFQGLKGQSFCVECMDVVYHQLLRLRELLWKEIERRIAEVPLDVS